MLRLMIIDDEPRALRGLKRLISQNDDVEVVGEAGLLSQAFPLIEQLQPDAIFLDVELKDGRGFDLIEGMEFPPPVVFVTAHSNYATRAFDISAVDYLLKPVVEERLAKSLDRLRRLKERASAEVLDNQRLLLKMPRRSVALPKDEIALLSAEGDFTRIFTTDGQNYFLCRLLGSFEKEVSDPPFIRISRSLIINVRHIERIDTTTDGKSCVYFNGRVEPIELGRIPARRLLQRLSHGKT